MTDTAPETRVNWVYERLKQAIVGGQLPPGTRLVTTELAQRISESMVEHEHLREAVFAGDVEQAVRVLIDHLHGGFRTIRAVLEARQERATVTAQ